MTVNGFPASVSYNQNQNNTAAAMATALTAALNAAGSPVAASVNGNTITITAKGVGTATNFSVAGGSTTSFTASSTTLSGGTDPGGIYAPYTTTYTYDALGDLLQAVQGQQTRTYVYDSLRRVTSSTIPETGYQAATAAYTDFGAPSQITDPRVLPGTNTHITTTFAYDPLNRLKTVTYNDGLTPGVTYTYNPPGSANNTGGRIAKLTNGTATETYQYDVMGRPTLCSKTISSQIYQIGYQYNADGTLASVTYRAGSSGLLRMPSDD